MNAEVSASPRLRVLVLGGTQFIGRSIVETLLAAGHEVTTLTRGRSPDELPAAVERLRGDRDAGAAGLAALAGRGWDVCVDVSGYTPQQVRPSAELLRATVRRYVFVSTVSVYGDPREHPVHEGFPLMQPAAEDIREITGETYGPLKVACEQLVSELYGDRATLLRPQIVAGAHDPTGRYPYWVRRAELGGEMLAPGDGTDYVQVIDVGDLARFTRTVLERDLAGVFNLAGPRLTWAAFLGLLGAAELVWVPADVLRSAGVTFVELPLFREQGGKWSGLMNVSNERALAAGLKVSDPAATAGDVRAWLRERELPLALSPEREAELIHRARTEAI